MQGEIQFIKKQIFGGFNRKDVVDYIAKMAKERNEAREACEEATAKVEELTAEIEALKLELENSKKVNNEVKDRKTLQKEVEPPKGDDDEPDAVSHKNVIGVKKAKAKVIRRVRTKS